MCLFDIRFVSSRCIWIEEVFKMKDIRQNHPTEVFLEKGVLKICSKFTGEHQCRSAISIKLQSNFIEITPRHGCSTVNLLHFFENTSSWEHLWWAASDRETFQKFFILAFLERSYYVKLILNFENIYMLNSILTKLF